MTTPPTIFLTGATGFLGKQIARQLLARTGARLLVLVRANSEEAALQRLRRAWWDWPELRGAIGQRVEVLCGDISLPGLGLSAPRLAWLAGQISHIVHSAADVRLFAPLDQLRLTNEEGTRQVLELARLVQAQGSLQRFAHVSSAFVAGKQRGEISEDHLSERAGFASPYERSKYAAELLVRAAADEFPVSVFRPGMIVGDTQTGEVQTFNTLYLPLRLYLTGQLSVAPANPRVRVNLIPVDYVADAVTALLFDPRAAGQTFHLVPAAADLPSLAEIADFTRAWAKREMGLSLPRARYLPAPGLSQAAPALARLFAPRLAGLAKMLPYFQSQPHLSRANTDRLLGRYVYDWRANLAAMLAYAVRHSFWQRAPRTVYEQVMLRLASHSRPIRYHDLAGGRETVRTAAELRAEILAAAAAIRALGVAPGERVALLGLNSTRYFAGLVASGLAGAVSAPLYATSPSEEIAALLRDSRAKLFLIGAPEVLARLDEIPFDGPVVSFCAEPPPPGLRRALIPWQEFIALGEQRLAQIPAPLEPRALDEAAVLCYTSGTTGEPKGVLYRHDQLRWLAETLASMYPWRERNRWGAYLSYLPMNHVVEGILAGYSPYYVPAALDIYFLADFANLAQALKTARPTIFFSVPRFFEKVRAALNENRLARLHQGLPAGPIRLLLGRLLRRGLLRKTGLDRCRQIIVGSAPSNPDLMRFFHELGVEIHDAYGLTEAPLVTLNRLGHNHLGTLGPPLPETELRIGPDGEVLIRGPQVAAGYLEKGALKQFEHGWLDSGDLGALTSDGCLTVSGRKKDFIITAYARKVFPAPLEAALRAVPGVAEAILIGESRPYCAALLWLAHGASGPEIAQFIGDGVRALNARLADPEQIKRWAVLPGELTARDGSLTGSLKMRRAIILERHAMLIDALYRGEMPPGVLHIGGLPL